MNALDIARASTMETIRKIHEAEGKDRMFTAISCAETIAKDAILAIKKLEPKAAIAAALLLVSIVHVPITNTVSTLESENAMLSTIYLAKTMATSLKPLIDDVLFDISAPAISQLADIIMSPAVCIVDRLCSKDASSMGVCLMRAISSSIMPFIKRMPEKEAEYTVIDLARTMYDNAGFITRKGPKECLFSESEFLLKEIVTQTVCDVLPLSQADAIAAVLCKETIDSDLNKATDVSGDDAVERLDAESDTGADMYAEDPEAAPTKSVVEHPVSEATSPTVLFSTIDQAAPADEAVEALAFSSSSISECGDSVCNEDTSASASAVSKGKKTRRSHKRSKRLRMKSLIEQGNAGMGLE
ncbi:hypothetical protein LPJ75_000129 [Coemansia sp. RSA 2598]|nr:hypothetical protein LPJ75_000129 [Coemansia sp. RSA 2598]